MSTNVSNVVLSSARMMNPTAVEPRIEVMFIIFFTSLFAASFPTLSIQIPILRIPSIIFFIGKHFGTGVILATAFIHLLDDAFRSLQNPLVKIRYGNIGKWTGLIILGSLLVIFLVEYISTSYVDYLHAKPSAPPTPIGSAQPSRPASLKPLARSISYEHFSGPTISRQRRQTSSTNAEPSLRTLDTESDMLTESTPLLPSDQPVTDASHSLSGQPRRVVSASDVKLNKSLCSRDHSPHHHHHHHHHHHVHHVYSPIIPSAAGAGMPIDVLTNSPRIFRQLELSHSHVHGRVGSERTNEQGSGLIHDDHDHEHHLPVGRRRQVIGLIVLQIGIMIHSLIIGLTLAVTDGSDFTSLTTAILFHQLFEGLSLGIRIASLPPNHIESHVTVEDEEGLISAPLVSPITPNLDFVPGAPSNSASHLRHSRIIDDSDSQNIGGRIEVQPPNSYLWTLRKRDVHWLKPTLSILFAVTTPFGMGVGMTLWKERDGSDTTQMLLIQGTMSAISAGMLIYAATVEMIAGDFVFGDVDGGHGHGHGHHPQHPHHESGGSQFDDHANHQSHIPAQSRSDSDDGKQHQKRQSRINTTVTKKMLAVISLFAGSAGMVLIGLGE